MLDWFIETGFGYLLGVALIPGVGLLLVCRGLWGDRSKGRVRCPKCWYDMRGSLPKLECPECGHDAQEKRRLYRTRRGRWRIVVGVLLVLLSAYPLTIVGIWYREQAIRRKYGVIRYRSDTRRIGPAWLIDRLPDELARFFDRVNYLSLNDRTANPVRATDADLVHLKHLWHLESLNLGGTNLTDAGYVHLKTLTNLVSLSPGSQVADAGLAHLSGLSKLEFLNLWNTQVSDAGLVHLRSMSKLGFLILSGTQVTDAGLVHLKGLSNLEKLWLADTQVTDAGLAHLKGLTNLKHLNLEGTQVTDAGLVHLKGLSRLVSLGLGHTQVTDAGLVHLKGLSKLVSLGLVLC